MTLFSEDIEFLRELYIHNSVNIYFFHEKYMLSPAQLGRSIRKFTDIGCICLNEDCINLTENGRRWIIANRRILFLSSKDKYWKKVPVEMTQKVLNVADTYRPHKLDSELFKVTLYDITLIIKVI